MCKAPNWLPLLPVSRRPQHCSRLKLCAYPLQARSREPLLNKAGQKFLLLLCAMLLCVPFCVLCTLNFLPVLATYIWSMFVDTRAPSSLPCSFIPFFTQCTLIPSNISLLPRWRLPWHSTAGLTSASQYLLYAALCCVQNKPLPVVTCGCIKTIAQIIFCRFHTDPWRCTAQAGQVGLQRLGKLLVVRAKYVLSHFWLFIIILLVYLSFRRMCKFWDTHRWAEQHWRGVDVAVSLAERLLVGCCRM